MGPPELRSAENKLDVKQQLGRDTTHHISVFAYVSDAGWQGCSLTSVVAHGSPRQRSNERLDSQQHDQQRQLQTAEQQLSVGTWTSADWPSHGPAAVVQPRLPEPEQDADAKSSSDACTIEYAACPPDELAPVSRCRALLQRNSTDFPRRQVQHGD